MAETKLNQNVYQASFQSLYAAAGEVLLTSQTSHNSGPKQCQRKSHKRQPAIHDVQCWNIISATMNIAIRQLCARGRIYQLIKHHKSYALWI